MTGPPQRSPAELNEALTHIAYEFWMMFEGAANAASMPTDGPVALRNAWIEVYVIHARVLTDFFSRAEPHWEDDICLRDFGEVDWSLGHIDKKWLRSQLSQPSHKRIAHLSWQRLEPLDGGWQPEIAQRLNVVGRSWREAVKQHRQDLDWTPLALR